MDIPSNTLERVIGAIGLVAGQKALSVREKFLAAHGGAAGKMRLAAKKCLGNSTSL